MDKKAVKIWNCSRTVKKSAVISSLEALKQTGKEKLGIAETDNVKIVLEEDGTEVDDEDYLNMLPNSTVFMILTERETWRLPGFHLGYDEADSAKPMFVKSNTTGDADEKLRNLAMILREDASRIMTMSSEDMQLIVNTDSHVLARLVGRGVSDAENLQMACQEHLDDRFKAIEAICALKQLGAHSRPTGEMGDAPKKRKTSS